MTQESLPTELAAGPAQAASSSPRLLLVHAVAGHRPPRGVMRRSRVVFAAVAALGLGSPALAQRPVSDTASIAPLTMGETFTLHSATLGEERRINVYAPPSYTEPAGTPRPVLYMPDGGIREDFLHIAGLLQVLVGNGSMRPFLLVGIENTERRRDLTGPTRSEDDRAIAPVVGGSAAFRRFIRAELMPLIDARYATSGETAIMGESLAGLCVVETLLLEPDLFDTYIAFDPSLWWDEGGLLDRAPALLHDAAAGHRTLYLASSREPGLAAGTARLAEILSMAPAAELTWHHTAMPDETHATIYHPAALRALRELFPPESSPR